MEVGTENKPLGVNREVKQSPEGKAWSHFEKINSEGQEYQTKELGRTKNVGHRPHNIHKKSGA